MRCQRSVGLVLTAIAIFASAPAALAYEIDYSPDRPQSLRDCDDDYFRGRRAEAARCYSDLQAGDSDVRIKAEAAWALGDVVTANSYFQQAEDEFPEDPRVRVRWARLFRATFQREVEVPLYQEALQLDPEHVPAIIGLAEAAADRFEGQSREWVNDALSLDSEAIRAHLLFARMELEVGNIDSAEVSLDRALVLTEQNGYPPLEVYALKASADLLRDNFESEWVDRALAYNASYGEIYAIPAYFFVITRRYREAIDYYRRAVELQQDNWSARVELGVNLMRDNRFEEALRELEIAAQGLDNFISDKHYNSGILIDSIIENFTVSFFDSETEPRGDGEGVILRLHEDEKEILTPFVINLINDSIVAFSERYGFEPVEPVVAEMYPEESDFSVRTAGLPGIGLLGVTFGYVVAMNSPPPGLSGGFHWGTTLWHEMAHVFTLEATDHLVPRWFSEGVSVFEEWSTGPLPGRHVPSHVLQAMSEGLFLPVSELDEGFIRPVYENQVIVSYMQAGLICEFIADSFGQQALRTMLVRFREGDDTPAALQAALLITPEEFDRRFAEHIETEFGEVLNALPEWVAAQERTIELAEAEDWANTLAAAEEAIALNPRYVEAGSAYLYLARAQSELDDEASARQTLERYFELGGYAPDALLQLGRWLTEATETDRAIEVYEALVMVAPLDPVVHEELGKLLLEMRPAAALRSFQTLAAFNPHDQANLNFRLAQAYLGLDDTEMATEHLLYALEIAPRYREAQQLLLEIVR